MPFASVLALPELSFKRANRTDGFKNSRVIKVRTDAGLTHGGFYRHFTGKDELYAAAVRQFLCKKKPAAWQKRASRVVTKSHAQRIVDAYFSHGHLADHDGCCPLLGTATDVERRGEMAKAAYQEVVEQMVEVFEDNLTCSQPHERALVLVALCVGGMVLARNVCDADLADEFRRSAYAEVLRTAGWSWIRPGYRSNYRAGVRAQERIARGVGVLDEAPAARQASGVLHDVKHNGCPGGREKEPPTVRFGSCVTSIATSTGDAQLYER